ncbi:MAG: 2-C-methyl-D-erythritol 4-phosphate cytidylyltransferase [Magnetococcales bacterium]|nr:2-C-methyl-D-erythritol 4-phosphate cytidylyltransferase [Magnetococcales bacterium]
MDFIAFITTLYFSFANNSLHAILTRFKSISTFTHKDDKQVISESTKPCTLILVAAGRGKRFGGPLPKQYQSVADRPIIQWTIQHLHQHPLIKTILPVISPNDQGLWQEFADPDHRFAKLAEPVIGGEQRQHSVFNGLHKLREGLQKEDWVAIHDGVRPFVSSALLNTLLEARDHHNAMIPAVTLSDTIKEIDSNHTIVNTPDRAKLRAVQTPQLFQFGQIYSAHQHAMRDHFIGTDDASLMERMGQPVHIVPGDPQNIKITQPMDRYIAQRLLAPNEGDVE